MATVGVKELRSLLTKMIHRHIRHFNCSAETEFHSNLLFYELFRKSETFFTGLNFIVKFSFSCYMLTWLSK